MLFLLLSEMSKSKSVIIEHSPLTLRSFKTFDLLGQRKDCGTFTTLINKQGGHELKTLTVLIESSWRSDLSLFQANLRNSGSGVAGTANTFHLISSHCQIPIGIGHYSTSDRIWHQL